jgi:hypothetical protein
VTDLQGFSETAAGLQIMHESVVEAVGEYWANGMGVPLEMITLPSAEILAMGVDEAGKWAAQPMAEQLGSWEWNFGGSPVRTAKYMRNAWMPHKSGEAIFIWDTRRI